MIRNTVTRDGATINAPVTAIAVRVNLHMNYQIEMLSGRISNSEEDDWIF